jgi:hypothetical protein
MKTGRTGMALAVLIFATCLEASDPTTTDARSDSLIGPVRSVSAREETQQTGRGPNECEDCGLGARAWNETAKESSREEPLARSLAQLRVKRRHHS